MTLIFYCISLNLYFPRGFIPEKTSIYNSSRKPFLKETSFWPNHLINFRSWFSYQKVSIEPKYYILNSNKFRLFLGILT